MKIINIFLIILLMFCLSCIKRERPDKVVSISQITSNYDSLVYKVKTKGNIDAYDELFYGFMDSNEAGRTDSVMVYSKIMAEKYKYEKAYIDYLDALLRKNDVSINYDNFFNFDIRKMDNSSKKQVVDWLEKMLNDKIITKEEFNKVEK